MADTRTGATRETAWSSTAPPGEFRPYVPETANVPEFTFKAVLFGAIFGIIFGAVTVYVGLRAGLTVSASIPIAGCTALPCLASVVSRPDVTG